MTHKNILIDIEKNNTCIQRSIIGIDNLSNLFQNFSCKYIFSLKKDQRIKTDDLLIVTKTIKRTIWPPDCLEMTILILYQNFM